MGSFYGTIAEQSWEMMEGKYPLSVDVMAAPKSPIECKGCNRRTVEGEPLMVFYLKGDFKMSWRRSYCGLCFSKQRERVTAALVEADTKMTELATKLGEGFYVAKEIVGKKGRDAIKAMAKEMVTKCECGAEKGAHVIPCFECDKPHTLGQVCFGRAMQKGCRPDFQNGTYGFVKCPMPLWEGAARV